VICFHKDHSRRFNTTNTQLTSDPFYGWKRRVNLFCGLWEIVGKLIHSFWGYLGVKRSSWNEFEGFWNVFRWKIFQTEDYQRNQSVCGIWRDKLWENHLKVKLIDMKVLKEECGHSYAYQSEISWSFAKHLIKKCTQQNFKYCFCTK
jgi:hypothetical protein